MRRLPLAVLLVMAAATSGGAAAASARAQTPATTLIADVTLVDVAAGALRPHVSVLVRGERIVRVTAASETSPPAGTTVIDGAGLFLSPGFWDMHAHLSYWGEDALQRLVTAGVTGIRELGGDPEEIGSWKREIDAGVRLGPTMIWCGPFIEGPDGEDEYRFKVADEYEARYAARALQALGVDFLKIQPAIEPHLVEALVDEAGDLGLTVVGHLPHGVDAARGAALGLRSIEHMSPYLELDDEQLDAVIAAYRRFDTWMSPALYSLVAPIEARGDDPRADQRLQRAYAIVRRFHAAGIPILVGSNFAYRDWPQTPGAGLHGEMRVLVDAGLPAADVLRLATVGAAEFAGRSDAGTVEPGRLADLVLLDASPLEDIRNTSRIVKVMLRGHFVEP